MLSIPPPPYFLILRTLELASSHLSLDIQNGPLPQVLSKILLFPFAFSRTNTYLICFAFYFLDFDSRSRFRNTSVKYFEKSHQFFSIPAPVRTSPCTASPTATTKTCSATRYGKTACSYKKMLVFFSIILPLVHFSRAAAGAQTRPLEGSPPLSSWSRYASSITHFDTKQEQTLFQDLRNRHGICPFW